MMCRVVALAISLSVSWMGHANAACTVSGTNWTCSADYTTLNDLINNNIPGPVQDGDTIQVTQTGSVSWASQLTITNRSFSLVGPGMTNLTIACVTDKVPCLVWTPKATGGTPPGFSRLSGFKFTQQQDTALGVTRGCQLLANGTTGSVNFKGNTANLRIDHNHFADVECGTLHVWEYVRGVVDHNIFENVSAGGGHSTNVEHDTWGNVGGDGDNSWASPSTWGSTNQLVFEDNTFLNSNPGSNYDGVYCTNDSVGARVTYRFNTWTNCTFQTHGTETNGRDRGQRHTEFYRNSMTWNRPLGLLGSIIAYRGGTMRTWDNKVTDVNNWILKLISFSSARHQTELITEVAPWGTCGPISITSITSSGNLATATFSGNGGLVHNNSQWLTISGANETKYVGTFLVQGSNHAFINDNQFQFTVSPVGATVATGTITARSPFDGNVEANGYPCMDQAGRGMAIPPGGIQISGVQPNGLSNPGTMTPNPPVWAGNELEPMYVWNNKHNLATGAIAPHTPSSPIYLENRDYYRDLGLVGVGKGLRSARSSPPCTPGTAYWATDGGGNWNTSTTEGYSAQVGYGPGADGALDRCGSGGTWENDWYVPLEYPHYLVSGASIPSATATITAPSVGSVRSANSIFTVSGTATAANGSLSQVSVYINGVQACSDIVPPLASWSCDVTAPLTPATYTLTARATDAEGLGPVSSGVGFVVPSSGGASSRMRFSGTVKMK